MQTFKAFQTGAKAFGLQINKEKTKYMSLFAEQEEGRNY